MRRGEIGTSSQHRAKSSIRHMIEPRISDNRALKVAEDYPGRPVASQSSTAINCRNRGRPDDQIPRRWQEAYPSCLRA